MRDKLPKGPNYGACGVVVLLAKVADIAFGERLATDPVVRAEQP